MAIIERLAERHIQRAIENGEFDNLEGAGEPLNLEPDDPFVVPELCKAYKIMKNAGYQPPELCIRGEIHQVNELIRLTGDEMVGSHVFSLVWDARTHGQAL